MKRSIRHKIFFIIAVILLFNILITQFFGSSLMEHFYTQNKKSELKQSYYTLRNALANLSDLEDNDLADVMFGIERNNITIMLVQHTKDSDTISYYSRGNRFPESNAAPNDSREPQQPFMFNPLASHYKPENWIAKAQALAVFDGANLPLVVSENASPRPQPTLNLYGQAEDGLYIFLSTPQEPLAFAASLAVQYNLYISLATFLLATILIYFISKRFTQPISHMDQAARRISQMDFSQRCDVHTHDELEELSISINLMADKLAAYIEQLKLNQALLEKDLAREAKTNQLRKEFIANVSHDFKTPLTLIRAYTESLAEQTLSDDEHASYCQIILKETERMTALVTRLLQLSKLESGVITLEESIFPLDEMMRDILHNSQILIKEKNLSIHLLPQDDCFAYGDYRYIEQVLFNLIDNAIKYTPYGGAIWLDIQASGKDLYRISITNTSLPLPEEQLEDLFISFYKRDQSRKADNYSFGLGLAIVKATLELHHQPYGACNTPNGLQFWFMLPAVTDL